MPRLYVPVAMQVGTLELPAAAKRHLHVLRLRGGDAVELFDGTGGEWQARVLDNARVEVLGHDAIERELDVRVTLALAMPANERMDWLVEKATELGAAQLQPLQSARSVLRLHGERAQRRQAHWQAIAEAACAQCGRNRVPQVLQVRELDDWLGTLPAPRPTQARCLLAAPAHGAASSYAAWSAGPGAVAEVLALSGPEGGLEAGEIASAGAAGFAAVSLGPRVLRAETAPLALLAALAVR